MSDIISREKTLDAIRDADVFVFYDADTEIDDAVEIAIRCTKKSVIDTINDLPSAEPKTPQNGSITSINPENTHDRTMGDCISRKDAIKSMANAIWHYPNELYTGLNSYETCEALAKDGLMFLPSAEPEWLTDDDFETIRIHLNAYKEKLCNQQRWEEAEEYQRIIDRFMAFASAQPDSQPTCNNLATDTISRQSAIDAVNKIAPVNTEYDCTLLDILDVRYVLTELPPAEPERKKRGWTTEEVAELLSNLFGDECACNYNGIDEWLPERCKYTEIADECPNPKEKHGCWMQFLLQGGADMRGEWE